MRDQPRSRLLAWDIKLTNHYYALEGDAEILV